MVDDRSGLPQPATIYIFGMQISREKIKSDLESILDTLLAPAPGISCSEASQRLSSICADHLKACAQSSAQPTAASGEDEDEEDGHYGNSTPGVPGFFLSLWSSVIERVQNTPVEEPAHHDYISRLVDFIGKTKENPQTNGDKWVVGDEECGWKDLPLLGQTIRDVYNEPIDTMAFNSSLLLSPEGQAAIAGASQIDDQNSESDTARLAQARHRWLSLQSFISCLWRDCGCDSYALYAIWAIRPALEDWPNSPPLRDTKCDTLEESPAYLALQVEAAAIWLCNTAPLMYKCTEIWGPNGNVDWPKRAGAPGKGGERWDGVDGYDREHKRWELWKDVLGEVVRWCDGMDKDIQGWKVKDAASRALEAMKEAER